MINLTDQPIIIGEGEVLDCKIRRAIRRLYVALDAEYKIIDKEDTRARKCKISVGKVPVQAFGTYFLPAKMPQQLLGDEFVQRLTDYCNIGPRNQGITNAFDRLSPFLACQILLPAHLGSRLKGIIRLLLFALWSEGAVLLPYSDTYRAPIRTAKKGLLEEFESSVSAFFTKYNGEITHRPSGATELPVSGALNLFKYGPRLMWATSFHRFEDLNLIEISQLHKALVASKRGDYQYPLSHAWPPMVLMLRELLICQPGRMNYTASDLEAFAIWSLSSSYQDFPFEDFLLRRTEIVEAVAEKRRTSSRTNRRAYSGAYIAPKRRKSEDDEETGSLALLAARQDHEAVVEYYCRMRGITRNGDEWLRRGAPYLGREHIDLASLSNRWLEAWLAYMKYRKTIQGFDSSVAPTGSFNLLCDYLFLYLPWWKELFPEAAIEVPLAPNQLKRALFVHRIQLEEGEPIAVSKLPMTFLDILPIRIPSAASRYGIIHRLMQFFEWLEIGFDEDTRIAGPGYRSPIRRIDLPRMSKSKKTTKTPFSKRVYPHLLFYAYALEAFGEYLQQVAMERPTLFSGKHLRQERFLSTGPAPVQVSSSGEVSEDYLEAWPDNFGYVPYVSYRGRNYPVTRVPNVYQWAERAIDLKRFGDATDGAQIRWLPHLTTLRMLAGAIETGLRLQSLQWLDARTWDAENRRKGVSPAYGFNLLNSASGHFALPMQVSTDKTKDEPWNVLVIFRVRACFNREQYFRDSIHEADMDVAVDYDGIENNRFGKIVPLFRSNSAPTPVTDHLYDRCWRKLLWGFEEHFNSNVADAGEFVQFVYLKGTEEDPVPDYSDTDLKIIRAINTPHACRATYATNRTGTLEASDVAQQLGHSSTVATAYYTVSTPEIMEEKLAAFERELQAGAGAFDPANPVYIRADRIDGPLYQGFQDNRAETINAFQFAPAVTLWSTEDLCDPGADGLQMLKASPMSQIRFRETHICPVGEACPADIMVKISEPRRCGLCPLAMRCVDHLPAIAAKINQLKMNVRSDIRRAEQMSARNEPATAVDPLYDTAELDANEIVGWQLSYDILLKMLKSSSAADATYHVQTPEIVQRHLQAVTADRTVSEFLLQRIADANAYPSMADPEVQRVADRFCRYLLAGGYEPSLNDDPVTVLACLVKTHMEPLGVTLQDLADRIDQCDQMREQGRPALINRTPLLLADTQGTE